MDSMELYFSSEFLPGIEVHPRHLRDPSSAENRVGIGLWHGAAGI